MPKINLLTLLPGDSQTTLIDKINYDFDQILTAGGGPQGMRGLMGATGGIGPQGEQGVTGPQGQEGSKWFVSASGPTSGSPLGIPIAGDYWLRDSDKEILRFGPSGMGLAWVDSGYNLRGDQIFSVTGSNWDTTSSAFDSTVGYYSKNDTGLFSLLLSDWGVDGTGPDYAGATLFGLNSEKSKLKLATSLTTSYSNLISFGRSDLDSFNNTSATFSNTHNPVIKWGLPSPGSSATAGTPNIWDVKFYNPIGNWDFITTAGNIGLTSNNLNKLETSALAGGTIVNFASNGYFQVLPSGSTGASISPYFSVNPTGAGVKTVPSGNNFSVKGSASFALNDSYNAFGLSGGYVGIEKGLRIAATGAAGNTLTVKGSSSIAQSDSYNTYVFGTGYMGVENGLRIGATGFNPYGMPVNTGPAGTGPGATGYLSGATEAYGWASSTGTYVLPKVLISGQGNGAVFQARLDNPSSTGGNAWLSWGDSTIYPFDNPAINNLSQEYVSASGPVATGTWFAGYYHGAANQTGAGSYSSASPANPDPVTQFQILSQYGIGTHISTYGQADLLNLNARQFGTHTPNARVVIGANNTSTMRTFQNAVRILADRDVPTDTRTVFTVEENGYGVGSYFGYRPSHTAAWDLPSAITYWPTGCQPTPAPFGSVNRIKVVGDASEDGMNGVNICHESDSTPSGLGVGTAFCFSGSRGIGKALTVTDYDHYTRNGTAYATLGYDGKLVLGQRAQLSGGSTILNTHYGAIMSPYWGPDQAQLFVFGSASITDGIRCSGDMYINNIYTDYGNYTTTYGIVSAQGFTLPSSRKLKDNIEPLNLGLEQISKLNPVSFTWKETKKDDIGFIAEEVFEILPEAAAITDGELTGYDPMRLIPVLTKSIQELMAQVADLKKEVELLKQK